MTGFCVALVTTAGGAARNSHQHRQDTKEIHHHARVYSAAVRVETSAGKTMQDAAVIGAPSHTPLSACDRPHMG
eukprot:m.59267 g.59267  ORF g.59267 m.59267 type:complete len:74 (-) comp15681_c0_seq4:55-276(-)